MEKQQNETVIAAFDFDGTITTKDTLFDFIQYSFGWPKFIIGMLLFLPTFTSYLLNNISNSEAKEKLFSIFFKGFEFEDFQKLGENYKEKISQILNNDAIEKINWHKKEGHKLIIISASIENWIEPWAKEFGFEIILATKAEFKEGKLTGKFSSKNCHGVEKVNRLLAEFPDRKAYKLYAYGDSSGDSELLKEAEFPFFKKFN
jgi:phosphatidylglycerophosphatase C